MCGIAGYLGHLSKEKGTALLQAMNTSLEHRGPDGEGVWVGSGVGLGHRRLAIIDLEGGAQPMISCAGAYRIVFNGEIYNYRALRDELEGFGYKFLTRSDTEIIPAVIDRWGVDNGLRRLRGMFAFAIYDEKNKSLLLARDRFGIKPLYIGTAPGLTLFGSEPKALLVAGRLDGQADQIALLDFFTLGEALSPRTSWSAIKELEPGTWLSINEQGQRRGRFHDWPLTAGELLTEGEALERVEEILTDSLKAHLESDVPLAAFLSGGIDSSVLVALLRKHLLPELKTFNVGFDEAKYDESPYARAVAAHCATEHHEIKVRQGEGSPELFKEIIEQYDQPFGDSSCLPTWMICKEMARHTKVVISGDGGDEMFGGYDRYNLVRQLTNLGKIPLAKSAVGVAGRMLSWGRPETARRLEKASTFANLPRAEMLCALHTYFTTHELRELLQPEFFREASVEGFTHERFGRRIPETLSNSTEQLIAVEIQTILHADYLRKVDVASMAHSLEVRTPFLDPEVFDLAMRLPLSLKVRSGSLKHVLRLLARKLLPHNIVDRPKQGFGIPFDRWTGLEMSKFLRDLLLGPSAKCKDWLQGPPVQTLLDAFNGSRSPTQISRFQVYQRVFLLASFELWLRKWSPTRP